MNSIHPTAIVDPECELGTGVEIGPWCILRGRVRLGNNTKLIASVQMAGPVDIGEDCIFYPGSTVGFPPQDFKFKLGDATAGVRIGNGTILREHATVHAASKPDNPTLIGNRVFMMVCSHVGHDARVGNNVILANSALLAGHSHVADNATMSGNTSLHQFGRVGRMAFVSGHAAAAMDVPPFCILAYRNRLGGVNLIGMRRAGFPREHITAVREAYRVCFRHNMIRAELVAELTRRGKDCPLVAEMAEFCANAKRPIAYGRGQGEEETGE
jgi:UDP-N-acetylglucosamine acyltransferase